MKLFRRNRETIQNVRQEIQKLVDEWERFGYSRDPLIDIKILEAKLKFNRLAEKPKCGKNTD